MSFPRIEDVSCSKFHTSFSYTNFQHFSVVYIPYFLPSATLSLALLKERFASIASSSISKFTSTIPALFPTSSAIESSLSSIIYDDATVIPPIAVDYPLRASNPTSTSASRRMLAFKSNKWKCKYSQENKMKKLQSTQRTKRQSLVESKRSGLGLTNLGIVLRITDDLIPELDMDPSQDIPPFISSLPISTLTVQNGAPTDPTCWTSLLFERAEKMVSGIFHQFDVNLDLQHTRKDLFTTDIVYDSNSQDVVAAMEFVIMQKYLWVESLCVNEKNRRLGLGRCLVDRLAEIAKARNKTILLYSLFDSIKFYLSVGFNLSAAFPFQEGHHGVFLTREPL